jgi:phage gp36-like protein
MPYCTLDDLKNVRSEEKLIQLTDDEDAGVVDIDKVNAAIEAADAEIDSYVGVKHSVPLSPVPVVVKDASVVLALYRLYGNRQGPDEDLVERRKEVIAWLRDVSKGTATLGQNDPSGTPPSGRAQIESSERIFSRETLKGF